MMPSFFGDNPAHFFNDLWKLLYAKLESHKYPFQSIVLEISLNATDETIYNIENILLRSQRS
ncbi:hypothetical protein A9Q83_08155 [Alphaproteobacteria bacterium 46_93_T64]|nr:hypothetical protein A9Q83_08155 [Alphaproteobacteria bacterium 46_93_T64]